MWYVSIRGQPLCFNWEQLCFSVFLSRLISVAAVVVGGIDMMAQSIVLAKKPHVVIGKKGKVLL